MWMIGYNDVGELISIPDSFNGVNLPPLIPSPANNAPCLTRFHATDLLALNHHLSIVAEVEQSRRELLSRHQQVNVVSSRWNPTPEQLETLEELYRQGTRTPSTDQIQHITSQLRQYGKIEGKNVFYWFQNHKTRDRQKRRRRHQQYPTDKESGASKTGFEVDEQTKNWVFPSDCSTLVAEKNASLNIQGAAKAAVPECITAGWVDLEEEEEAELQQEQQRRSFVERNAMWQMVHSSCSPLTHLMNNNTNNTTSRTIMDPKRTRDQDLKIFIAPARDDLLDTVGNYYYQTDDDEAASFGAAAQTLQLFPLRSDDDDDDDAGNENNSEKETEEEISLAADFTPYQFFEFLPLKN